MYASDQPARISVRTAVLHLLRSLGMTTIFGNPGSTELPMFREFPPDFRYVLGLQESIVVAMADGYAQATGQAAFVNLHSAAGVGHAMGNVFTAFKNRTPLVITAGQQARSLLQFEPYLFSDRATQLPLPYVKWACEPARAEDVPRAIARAFLVATQPPRGPVFVSIPVDDWEALSEVTEPRQVYAAARPDPAALESLRTALAQSDRPAFVVGAAVDRDGAWDEVVRLAEQYSARVWVSPVSGRCSFPESHRLFAGFLPAFRERIVECLTGHDLILVLGAPVFTYHFQGSGPHVPAGARLIQVTDEPDSAAYAAAGVSIVTGLRLCLQELLKSEQTRPRTLPFPARRPTRVAVGSHAISVDFLMQALTDVRPDDSIIVEEAPSSRHSMQAHLPINRSGGFFTTSSGGLGYGLPAAIGVALGRPERPVIGIVGDGSSMYAIQGLWTAAQLGLPITFVVVNNRRYAAMHEFAALFGISHAVGTDLTGIDFVGLAKSQGCYGVRVQDAGELCGVLDAAIESRAPSLVEVCVE